MTITHQERREPPGGQARRGAGSAPVTCSPLGGSQLLVSGLSCVESELELWKLVLGATTIQSPRKGKLSQTRALAEQASFYELSK